MSDAFLDPLHLFQSFQCNKTTNQTSHLSTVKNCRSHISQIGTSAYQQKNDSQQTRKIKNCAHISVLLFSRVVFQPMDTTLLYCSPPASGVGRIRSPLFYEAERQAERQAAAGAVVARSITVGAVRCTS